MQSVIFPKTLTVRIAGTKSRNSGNVDHCEYIFSHASQPTPGPVPYKQKNVSSQIRSLKSAKTWYGLLWPASFFSDLTVRRVQKAQNSWTPDPTTVTHNFFRCGVVYLLHSSVYTHDLDWHLQWERYSFMPIHCSV